MSECEKNDDFCLSAVCDLIGCSDSNSPARDSSTLPLPPALWGGTKYPSSWARDSSSLPMHLSGGSSSGGKYSPTPVGGSGGVSLHLNPTTLAMLQQHNFIPYFRGTRAQETLSAGGLLLFDGLVQLFRPTHASGSNRCHHLMSLSINVTEHRHGDADLHKNPD